MTLVTWTVRFRSAPHCLVEYPQGLVVSGFPEQLFLAIGVIATTASQKWRRQDNRQP